MAKILSFFHPFLALTQVPSTHKFIAGKKEKKKKKKRNRRGEWKRIIIQYSRVLKTYVHPEQYVVVYKLPNYLWDQWFAQLGPVVPQFPWQCSHLSLSSSQGCSLSPASGVSAECCIAQHKMPLWLYVQCSRTDSYNEFCQGGPK